MRIQQELKRFSVLILLAVMGTAIAFSNASSVLQEAQTDQTDEIDVLSLSDAELLAVASRFFTRLNQADVHAKRFDERVAGRLRSLVNRREELGLEVHELGNLVRWVGQYKDKETTELLIDLLEQPLKPVLSPAEVGLLFACHKGLGDVGATAEGLEYLKGMISKEYWLAKNVQPQCPDCAKSLQTPDEVRRTLRNSAFWNFYRSCSQSALETLYSGKGIPADMLPSRDFAIRYIEACLRGEKMLSPRGH